MNVCAHAVWKGVSASAGIRQGLWRKGKDPKSPARGSICSNRCWLDGLPGQASRFARWTALIGLPLMLTGCGASWQGIPPVIASEPASQSVTAGQPATLTGGVSGTAPFVYAWSRNGVAIPGAAASSYTVPGTTLADSGVAFAVAVTNPGGTAVSAPAVLTVNPIQPTLAFASPGPRTYGGAPFAVTASSASPGAVSYAVTRGPATLSGSTVTLTGAGEVVLAAAQAASGNFGPATASTTFTVNPATPVLQFAPVASKTFGDAPFSLVASSASAGQVTYAVEGGPATLAGGTVTLTGAGTVVVSATQKADGNYTAATATASFTVAPAAPTTAVLSATTFAFGPSLVGSTVTQPVVTVRNTGAATLYLQPALDGDPSYHIAAGSTCAGALVAGARCSVSVSYAPTAASGASPQTSSLDLHFANAGTSPQTVALAGEAGAMTTGVAATNNPQVALYTVTLPYPGTVTVLFGPTTAYGRQTWTKAVAANEPLALYVAGMLPNATYHLQAAVQLDSGNAGTDTDHTFTTGAPPFGPALSVAPTPGMSPEAGIEQMTVSNGQYFSLVFADLAGNVLWSYALTGNAGGYGIEGAKLLHNGNFLVTLGEGSAYPLISPTPRPDVETAIREIDLAGNTVRELTIDDLTARLQAGGHNLTLQQFHHDVTELPNGHWLVLANILQDFTDLPGYPGTTSVLGDVVVDLDQNLNPVWVWNEFDHMDVNRHPWNFPDWTHTNALLYSPSDGNLIVSLRHQNWVVKVDYRDGAGSGNILWHLGEGGDFALVGGTDPTDWNFAQHGPSFFSANTAGVFSLGMLDNGDDREFPSGVVCNSAGQPVCLYTTVPVFQIDEQARTATLTFHQILPASLYSFFGGNAELLANGDIEYDLAATNGTSADLFEVTPGSNPQTVWHMHSGYVTYRGYRVPSLYPGVQW